MRRMRYIIIGAGAVGGTIGGCLFQGGHEVVLVARGAHLDALRRDGLRLATPFGTEVLPIPAVSGPGEIELRHDDVLILTAKTQDAEALLAEWAWQPVSAEPAKDAPTKPSNGPSRKSATAGQSSNQIALFKPDVDLVMKVNSLEQQANVLRRQLNEANRRAESEQQKNRALKGE